MNDEDWSEQSSMEYAKKFASLTKYQQILILQEIGIWNPPKNENWTEIDELVSVLESFRFLQELEEDEMKAKTIIFRNKVDERTRPSS